MDIRIGLVVIIRKIFNIEFLIVCPTLRRPIHDNNKVDVIIVLHYRKINKVHRPQTDKNSV
jgi:hypothetical protein